jgi:serine/threonine-protein kinase HipA
VARQVNVFFYTKKCGVLSENGKTYTFIYDDDYRGKSLSLSMPVAQKVHVNEGLHPFFKGLAPEGWLRKQYSDIQHIDERDLFGFLIRNNKYLLGAVTFDDIV